VIFVWDIEACQYHMQFCWYSILRFAKRFHVPYVPRAVCVNFKLTLFQRSVIVSCQSCAFPCFKLFLFLFPAAGWCHCCPVADWGPGGIRLRPASPDPPGSGDLSNCVCEHCM